MSELSGGFAADRLELWFDVGSEVRRPDQGGVRLGFAGSLENLPELATAVRLPRGDTPTVLVRAWSLWDEAMLKRLRGAFAVCLWDSGRRRGLIAVDPNGRQTVYYRALGPRLRFAADLPTLLSVLSGTPKPDGSVPEDTGSPSAGALPEGVERLTGGGCLRLTSAGWESVAY
jgi:asparagine synthetase B (glutamine-hydrolysing)